MKSYAEKRWGELVHKPNKTQEEEKEMEESRIQFGKELLQDASELYTDLKEAGEIVYDIWDLVNTPLSYPNAIPVLIKHLPKKYHLKNRDAIVRSLSVKEAKGMVTPILIEELPKLSEEEKAYDLDWVMYNTILHTAVKSDIVSIIPIVLDKKNGLSRYRLVETLGKVRTPEGEQTLVQLLDDDEMAPYAIKELGKMKSQAAKSKIQGFLNHRNKAIKVEAEKALKRIG